VTLENQIMDLLARRRRRLFCKDCIARELRLPNPGDIKDAIDAIGRAKGFRRATDTCTRRDARRDHGRVTSWSRVHSATRGSRALSIESAAVVYWLPSRNLTRLSRHGSEYRVAQIGQAAHRVGTLPVCRPYSQPSAALGLRPQFACVRVLPRYGDGSCGTRQVNFTRGGLWAWRGCEIVAPSWIRAPALAWSALLPR
jgi:hypothetical protein